MIHTIRAAVLSTCAVFLLAGAPALASPGGFEGGGWEPGASLMHLVRKANLTSDQQTQIKPILANQQQQMMALRGDSSLSREDRMAKMKGIRDDSNTKIQAILNDSQKAKYAEDQQKMQERMQQRGGGGPAAAPPAQ